MDNILERAVEIYGIDYELVDDHLIILYKDITFKLDTYDTLIKKNMRTINKIYFKSVPRHFFDKIDKNNFMIFLEKSIDVDDNYVINVIAYLDNFFY